MPKPSTERDRSKGGRPRLSSRERRGRQTVYVNSDDWEDIRRRAAGARMSASSWLVTAALNRRLPVAPPEASREALRLLAAIGNNLNQIAHQLNASQLAPNLEPVLEELRQGLLEVRRDLHGRTRS